MSIAFFRKLVFLFFSQYSIQTLYLMASWGSYFVHVPNLPRYSESYCSGMRASIVPNGIVKIERSKREVNLIGGSFHADRDGFTLNRCTWVQY